MDTVTTTWQESLANLISSLPEDQRQRAHDFFVGYIAAMQEEVKKLYPYGFTEAMMRIDKPNGDFFYAVPFDTEEVAYLVKIDVKIDDGQEDDNDGYYDEDDLKGADELADAADDASDDDF